MNLDERAMLVSLKISLPTGTRRDKQATEDVEKLHNARNLGRFNKDLINKKFTAKVKAVESQARAYLYMMTLPWGDNGSRLIAVRRHAEFAAKMLEFGNMFDTEAATIITQWPAIVVEAQQRLNGLFDPRQYPGVDTLGKKFRFRVSYTSVPRGDDLRVALDDAVVGEMRAQLEEEKATYLKGTQVEAWSRLYEKVEHMAVRLADPEGRVYDSVVEGLAEVCDILPDLNFTDDPRLANAIAIVKKTLLVTPDKLRASPETKVNTAAAARLIADRIGGWMTKE